MKRILAVGGGEDIQSLISGALADPDMAEHISASGLLGAIGGPCDGLVMISADELRRLLGAREGRASLRERVAVDLLARANEFRSDGGGGHIKRVSMYACVIMDNLPEDVASSYYIPREYYEDIKLTAPLHDVGEAGIPDHILLKPGKLSAEEFEIVKSHAETGARFLKAAMDANGFHEPSFFDAAIEIALTHHEKWDGTGYPAGLSGENIPLSGRITAIADVYDALTSKRPYKPPLPHERAVAIISENSGKHFDPVLVDIFVGAGEEMKRISDAAHGGA